MRALLLAAVLLAGCTRLDPYHRAGMWQPEGVNQGNLAAQVADPRVLVWGHGATGASEGATAAVEWLRLGHPVGFNALGGGTPAAAAPHPGSGPAATPGGS
jgi:type IV pilus biogenesis protein CpaD/CtpE